MNNIELKVYKSDNTSAEICFNLTGDFKTSDKPLQILQPTKYYSKYESLKDQIDSFISLNENWDGYGSTSVIEEIGHSAKIFLSSLSSSWIEKISDIYPNPHGTIAIEWENNGGEKLSLELGRANFSYFVKQDNNQPVLIDGDATIPNLKDFEAHLDKLFGKDVPRIFLEPRENS